MGKKQKAKSVEDDMPTSSRFGIERHVGGNSFVTDLDATCERSAASISPQVIGHETELSAPSHSSTFSSRSSDFPKPQTSPTRNADIITTVPEDQCAAHEADAGSDGESLMSRCCRCFAAREARERVSPEEK